MQGGFRHQIFKPGKVDHFRDLARALEHHLSRAHGRYTVNKQVLSGRDVGSLGAALAEASGGSNERIVIISADANAAHQSVINVMDAARRVGLQHLSFATQAGRTGAGDSN